MPAPTLPVDQPDPLRTLGWGVVLWCSKYLRQPDGPNAGERWQFTPSQVHFLLWFYALDDEGRFLYHRGARRRAKGAGKSPKVAAQSLAEFRGPVRFGGWDLIRDDGPFPFLEGVPVSMPWVQIAATAESQTVNTMSMVSAMAPKGSRLATEYGLDLGKTRIYSPDGGRLEIITASAHAAEGARATFAVEDETEWWLETNGGHALDATIRRNLAKTGGRMIETCNAFVPGQDSVAERTHDAWVAQVEGRTRRGGLLYDALEAPAATDPADEGSLRAGLSVAYEDAPWVDLDRIVAEYYDPSTDPSIARRFYLNQLVAGEDAWLAPHEWAECADPLLSIADGEMVTLGFDGSVRDDSTALVVCRVEDGHLELVGCWEKPDLAKDDWQVDREAVDAEVAAGMDRWQVVGFYADPAHWQDYLDRWASLFGHRMLVKASAPRPLEWWTNRPTAMITALERFHEAVVERQLTHDGGSVLTRHVLNAHRRVTRSGITIGKEHPSSKRKIDAAMAAVLAYECRADAVAKGFARPKRKRRAVGF
jgi:hypothetical protein